MFQLDKTIVSEDILERDFVCNLEACKGACCVKGDAGAPLEEDELSLLDESYAKLRPFLRKEGIAAIEEQGAYTTNELGERETTLINGEDCAYVIYDDKGIALCGIEEAYNNGAITFKKPISCHLYPIRIRQYSEFAAVNYDRWEICKEACALGRQLQVPVYRFVKQALIRKFGEKWYHDLERIAKRHEEQKS